MKRILGKIGLLKAARVSYSFFKGLSLHILREEFRMRRQEIPLPPGKLIFLVMGYRWKDVFLQSGKKISSAMFRLLEESGVKMDSFASILDFGCGCGRIIRYLPQYTSAKLYGCDYNPELISWCSKNLTFAEFRQNELAPPLSYSGESFDLIYARSVFTHLDEHLQKLWMAELLRMLKPGGYLYFTMHGEQFFDQLSESEIEAVRKGNLVVLLAKDEGHNICASFELAGYARAHLLEGFELVAYEPGSKEKDLMQDGYLVRKKVEF